MATSKAAPDRDAIVAEMGIAAPPERVFQALVDPQQVLQWWGQQAVDRATEFQTDLRPGGKWRTRGVNAEGRNFEASGEYLEIDPPGLLVYSWVASWTGEAKTTVRSGARSGEERYARKASSSRARWLSTNSPRATAAGRECSAGSKPSWSAAKPATIAGPRKPANNL